MIKILAWSAVAVTFSWVFFAPGFEPIAAFLGSFLTATILQFKKDSSDKTEMVTKESEVKVEIKEEVKKDEIKKTENVLDIVDRFINLLEIHDIHKNEIPRFLPEEFSITLTDVSNKEKLLLKLSPAVIDWACSTFNVRREWLETGEKKIYDTKDYYKMEHGLLSLIKNIKLNHGYDFEVIAFKSVENLELSEKREQNVNLLIVVPTIKSKEKTIYKYIPTRTLWDWGYWRTRYQFKAITRICLKELNFSFEGYDLDSERMYSLSSGRTFPKTIIEDLPIGITWYPDDYCEKNSENGCNKESTEIDSILEYIKDRNYDEIFREHA